MKTPRRLLVLAARICAPALIAASLQAPFTLPSAAGDHDHHGHGEEGEGHGHDDPKPVELGVEALRDLGVEVRTAGPGTVRVTLALNGELAPQEDKVAHVVPRYPGVIREVRKRLGDRVSKGDAVAVVEGNQSLQPYEVTSPLTGVVVERHATAGEFAGEGTTIFEVADYGELYVDLYVFPTDFGKVRVGQPASIRVPGQPAPIDTTITFLSPVTDPLTQSRFVRGVVRNDGGALQPGMFVTGEVVVSEAEAPVVIDASALRASEGKPVVFVEHNGVLEPQPVAVGRRGGSTVEVLSGLSAGERYAAGNTFILQAELEKGEAGHEH